MGTLVPGVLFLLPILSVSCDAPGGYGRMSPGGTTTYTGLDLAMGSLPSVDNDHLRPAAEQQSDDLGVQPLVAVAALLVVGTLLARATLVDRVAEQATVPFPRASRQGTMSDGASVSGSCLR